MIAEIGSRKPENSTPNTCRFLLAIGRSALSVGRWTFAQNFLNVPKLCDLIESNNGDWTVAIFSRSIQYLRHVDGFEPGDRDHLYLPPV